jgi:hypothetical protein
MARKVHASFKKFQALVGPRDHVAKGAYHQFVAGVTMRLMSNSCLRAPCRFWVAVAILLWLPAHAAEAQETHRPFRIGVLNAAWAASHPTVEGLKAGLKELGVEDGRDVTFDIRFTEGKLNTMPAAEEALVKAGVDLIFTSQEAATHAAKDATESVPIVFTLVGDPVGAGIVAKLAQPRRQRDGGVESPDGARGEASGGPQDTDSDRPPGLARLLRR